jgi:predicted DNA repair protein MutK
VLHGIGPLSHFVEGLLKPLAAQSGALSFFASTLVDLVVGVIVGAIVVACVTAAQKLFKK